MTRCQTLTHFGYDCNAWRRYLSGGQLTPIDLCVEETYHRAAPGGTGSTKCIGNYSPVLKVQLAAKAAGFSDVIYLDAVENKYIEEVSSCNFFVVKGNTIATPSLGGSILPGREPSSPQSSPLPYQRKLAAATGCRNCRRCG